MAQKGLIGDVGDPEQWISAGRCGPQAGGKGRKERKTGTGRRLFQKLPPTHLPAMGAGVDSILLFLYHGISIQGKWGPLSITGVIFPVWISFQDFGWGL